MFEVRDCDNVKVIATDDFDLAELVMYASAMITNKFHKIMDVRSLVEFEKGRSCRGPFEIWQGPTSTPENSSFG